MPDHRWPVALVTERWNAMTHDEREAILRYGWKQAPWESVPDAAYRLLKLDRKCPLDGARRIDAIFRAAYEELAA